MALTPKRLRTQPKSCRLVSKPSVLSSTNKPQLRSPARSLARPLVHPVRKAPAMPAGQARMSSMPISKSSMTTKRRAEIFKDSPSWLAVNPSPPARWFLKTYIKSRRRTYTSMAINVKPLGDRVLVQPLEEKEVKKGGIIIPDTAKEKPQEGTVVAIGTGKLDDNGKKIDFNVKVGDNVFITNSGATEIKIDGENYLIMREDDILGIIG